MRDFLYLVKNIYIKSAFYIILNEKTLDTVFLRLVTRMFSLTLLFNIRVEVLDSVIRKENKGTNIAKK